MTSLHISKITWLKIHGVQYQVLYSLDYNNEDVQTVRKILEKLGLTKYSHIFEENEVNFEAFKCLEFKNLIRMDIPQGPCALIEDEIKRIKNKEPKGII